MLVMVIVTVILRAVPCITINLEFACNYISHLELKGKVLTRDLSSRASSAPREAMASEKIRDLTFDTLGEYFSDFNALIALRVFSDCSIAL